MTRLTSFIRNHARVLSFFGALLVTSTLVFVLFDEARAVSVAVQGPSLVETDGYFTFDVNFDIPADQLLPVQGSVARITRVGSGETRLASCPTAGDCTQATFEAGASSAFISIKRLDTKAASFGYLTVQGGYTGTLTGGSWGYAGSTRTATDVSTAGYGYGYGYGYSSAGGALKYRITVNSDALPTGEYKFVFFVKTGSGIIGPVGSAPHAFTVVHNAVGGGSSGPTPPPATPPTRVVPVPPITREGGITTARTTISNITANERASVALSSVDSRLGNLKLNFGRGGSSLNVVVRASDTPFEGAVAIPTGWNSQFYLQIEIEGDAELESSALAFNLDAGKVGDRAKAVTMLHFKNGKWIVEPTRLTGSSSAGFSFEADLDGFSPFAVTFDEEAPTVSSLVPRDGGVVSVRPLIQAKLADNRGINTTASSMTLDGQSVAATVTSQEILYTPPVALTPGAHTVRVHAVDLSGLSTTAVWNFTVSSESDTVAPRIVVATPADNSFLKNARPVLRASIADDRDLALATAAMTLDGAVVAATVTPTDVSYTPAVPLADGLHTVRVSVEDESGNGNFVVWRFTVDTVAPVIGAIAPADGAKLANARPEVSAAVTDGLSGLGSVVVAIDGQPVTATQANGVVTYTPAADLAAGKHTVRITAVDLAGNEASKDSSFEVESSAVETPSATTQPGEGGGWGVFLVIGLLAVVGIGAFFVLRKK